MNAIVHRAPSEAMYDAFARIAAQMCGVQIAGVSFVDSEREWFRSAVGLHVESIPRGDGFAECVIEHGDLLEIPDAAQDARVRMRGLVTGSEQIRFFAGLPLHTQRGEPAGAFFVMSRTPQWLTPQQQNGLRELAGVLMAAQAQVALLLSAIDVAGDVILVYRVEESGDLSLVYMNEAYTRQTGYSREEAVGRSLTQFRHAMPDDPGMSYLRDAIERGRPEQMEIVSYRKDGSSFWNQVTLHPIRDVRGRITHWISVERDVTEAVERESKLEDQQARLLLLTSAARRLFGALDPRTLIARLQEAVRDLIGVESYLYALMPDGRAVPTSDLRVPLHADTLGDEMVERASRTREHVTSEDWSRAAVSVAPGGRTAYVLEIRAASGKRLRNGDLFVLDLLTEYFAVAVRNASLVQELEERRSGILELNQTKSDLISMLAHDYKGPLTSIVGFAELAMELGDVNQNQREYLESVKRVALRLADLATDTLAVAHMERNDIDLRLAGFDLAALAADVALSFETEREIHVHAHGDASIRADAQRVRQVINTLVDNAIKYSPGGAPVEITVDVTGEGVALGVTDRGIGIPDSEKASIFGRFFRASNARKLRIYGAGLGLYLARRIVELHGGTIEFSSAQGQGSTFSVKLPSAAVPAAPRLWVALLDTQTESRSFLAHSLREAGLRVRVLRSPEEFFDALGATQFDRLVVDVDDMPLVPEQIARIESEQQRCGFSIIALGIGGAQLFRHAASLGKPFLVQDLLTAIGATRSRPA